MKYRAARDLGLVEAVKWDGRMTTVEPLLALAPKVTAVEQEFLSDNLDIVHGDSGSLRVEVGDYILVVWDGFLAVWRGEDFESRYEPVEATP